MSHLRPLSAAALLSTSLPLRPGLRSPRRASDRSASDSAATRGYRIMAASLLLSLGFVFVSAFSYRALRMRGARRSLPRRLRRHRLVCPCSRGEGLPLSWPGCPRDLSAAGPPRNATAAGEQLSRGAVGAQCVACPTLLWWQKPRR